MVKTGVVKCWVGGIVGFVAFLLIFSPIVVLAEDGQEKGGIVGYVLDNGNRKAIAGANVIIEGTTLGAAADLDGFFMIKSLDPGVYHLTASALGYQAKTISEIVVTPGRNRQVEFLLEISLIEGDEVTFTATLFKPASPQLPTSSRNMSYEEVRRAPGAIEDVQRMVQAMPGVVNQNDQTNEIVVRGGSPYENLTVIDGIEVSNTNHFSFQETGNGGAINSLNTEFLRDVTFAAGGFAAKYGDRMSSVLELNLREGDRENFGGAVDLSMAGLGGYVEGPVNDGKGSYLVTAHQSFLDFLPKDAVGITSIPHYWNSQAKFTYDLSPKHFLTINALYSEDNQRVRPEDIDDDPDLSKETDGIDFNTTRHMYGARLRSLWAKGYTDLIVARTYSYLHWNLYEEIDQNGEEVLHQTTAYKRTDIQDQFHLHWNAKGFGRDEWGAGISLKPVTYKQEQWVEGDSILFDDGYIDRDALGQPVYNTYPDTFYYDDINDDIDDNGLKYAAYLQYSYRPVYGLTVTGGLRYDGFDYSEEHVVGPRLALNYEFVPRWTLSLAWGQYYQAQEVDVYMDDAADVNKKLPYSKADQYIAGLSWNPRPSSIISVEGYFKNYDKLLVAQEDIYRETTGDDTYQSDVWLAERTKKSWGFELFAQQKLYTSWYGMLSYSYGESKADDDAFGEYYSDYDHRHVFTGSIGYKTNIRKKMFYRNSIKSPWLMWLHVIPVNGDELTISTKYRYMTGRPYTDKSFFGVDDPLANEPIYESHWEDQKHNDTRYPDYQRWDIRIDNKYFFGRSTLMFYIEAQNILDNTNIADYFYNDAGKKEDIYQFKQFYVMGIRYEF